MCPAYPITTWSWSERLSRMTRILDHGQDTAVMRDVLEMVDVQGYTAEEAIPGLVMAIIILTGMVDGASQQALDEAANLLADGPVEEDVLA